MLAEKGETAKILYDSGWQYAFSLRFDMVLAVFLLLFFSCIYDMEYKSGVYRLASISAKGIASLHKSKLLLSLIVTTIAFLICFGIDMFFLLQSYALPHPFFSASIILDFSAPLAIALFMHSCVKILVTILFVTSVVHLARGLRRTYLVLPVGLLILAAFGFVTNL